MRSGHVRLDGARIRTSRPVRAGDRLLLDLPKLELELELVVLALPVRRGPAPEAQSCYRVERREERARRRQGDSVRAPAPAGRPDKRSRKALRGLKRR